MPRTACHQPARSLIATIRLCGQDFTFRLYTRPLSLGSAGVVQYYWMDSSQFRNLRTEASLSNFRNCLGHWAAAMRSMGLADNLDQQVRYVTALCWPLVCRSKCLQDVYRDAFLVPRSLMGEPPSLPADVRERIGQAVRGRDRFVVQRELDSALGRSETPPRVLPALQEAFRRWVGNGVVLMRQNGNDGLEQFLASVHGWLTRYRKKGGHAWVRHFINLFAYEAKASFYTCYANAWVDLIPWLKEHHGLDQLSERFLRFWHNQNQPVEVPHGRTLGGVHYPTHGRATVIERGPGGHPQRRSLIWETEPIGPTHVRDAFSGQVLSLHPLSGLVMQDPGLCAVAGRFFGSEAYQRALVLGLAESCAEYWDLVGAILAAAHLYRQAADAQASMRGARHRGGAALDAVGGPDEGSETALLEDFAAAQGLCCPDCSGPLCLRRHHPAELDDQEFRVDYACRPCSQDVTATFSRQALEDWLRD